MKDHDAQIVVANDETTLTYRTDARYHLINESRQSMSHEQAIRDIEVAKAQHVSPIKWAGGYALAAAFAGFLVLALVPGVSALAVFGIVAVFAVIFGSPTTIRAIVDGIKALKFPSG